MIAFAGPDLVTSRLGSSGFFPIFRSLIHRDFQPAIGKFPRNPTMRSIMKYPPPITSQPIEKSFEQSPGPTHFVRPARRLISGFMGLLSAGSLHATDFVVTTGDDETFDGGSLAAESADGNGLSLREAITLANQNGGAPNSGDDDGDTISMSPTAFLLAAPTLNLTSELIISDDVVIDGNIPLGALFGRTEIDGAGATRLLNIETTGASGNLATVVLRNLDLSNGFSGDQGGAILVGEGESVTLENLSVRGSEALDGGGIYSSGSVTIRNSVFEGNTASGPSGSGGAIFNAAGGKLTISDSSFTDNLANRAGGAIEDQSGGTSGFDLLLTDVTFSSNNAGVPPAVAAPGNGGAIHVTGSGSVQINNGSASGNRAAREGGAYWNGSGLMELNASAVSGNIAGGPAADDGGGGIFNNGGTLTLTGGSVSGNTAEGASGSGGGVFSTDGAVTVTNTAIAGNIANRAGGGIELINGKLSLSNVILGGTDAAAGNIAGPAGTANPGNGGALHISGAAEISISGGLVANNVAAREGGGLWNQKGSTMTLTAGTFINANVASGDAADDGGGGIFNNGGVLEINNTDGVVAIVRNSANGAAGSGGGLHNASGSITRIIGAVFSENQANRAGGAIEEASGVSGETPGLTLTDVTMTINNAGVAPATGAPGSGGGLHVSGTGDVAMTGGTVAQNIAASEGGGLWNGGGLMTVSGVTIAANTASGAAADQGGGGIFNAGGEVQVMDSTTITGNIADGASGSGGGILNDVGGLVAILDSQISGNRANRAGGAIEDNSGAGLGLTVENSTLEGNLAGVAPAVAAPGNGGGLHITGPGDATFTGGTVSKERLNKGVIRPRFFLINFGAAQSPRSGLDTGDADHFLMTNEGF